MTGLWSEPLIRAFLFVGGVALGVLMAMPY
jgi:hypothetical protein